MEKTRKGNSYVYLSSDDTLYTLTALTPVAALLGATQLPADAKADLEYIWNDSGVQKLVLFVPADQPEYIKTARGLGFKQEGRMKKALPDGDLLLFGQYR